MKKILTAVFLACFLVFNVQAQTKTATPSPTSNVEDNDIKALREKIASKVAEQRQKNNKAVSGLVASASAKLIKIKTEDNEEYTVNIDDALTKYYQVVGNSRKEVDFSDIAKGSYVIVEGVINDKQIDANALYLDTQYFLKTGKITEVNKEDYSIKVLTTEKDIYILDVETYTKQLMLNMKSLALETIGFSKIREGDTIQFVVKKPEEEQNPNRFSAQRFIIIPQEFFMK